MMEECARSEALRKTKTVVNFEVARPPRFERGTTCLEGRCSIQLSYGRNRCADVLCPVAREGQACPERVFAHTFVMRRCLTCLCLVVLSVGHVFAADDWLTLFNGKDLNGWRANVLPESFSVVDGSIRANATKASAHLFYVGDLKEGFVRFKNFELELSARSESNSNSGIFVHTDMTTRDRALHLAKGYEIQLNSSEREKRKTGSLYAVIDLDKSPVDESQWFHVRVTVRSKRITVHLNDRQVIDYAEPEGVQRPAERAGRVLDANGGGIALQAHDPKSVFYFKDIRIRRLPSAP